MKNKKKLIIIVSIIVVLFIIVFLLLGFLGKNRQANNFVINYPKVSDGALYDERLFDSNYLHEVNITISSSDWKDLINNPLDKTNYKASIQIDGINFDEVAFRTKGNSSLKSIAEGPGGGPASTRYSFSVDFGKYVDGQSYYGLDTLNLNNIFGDATYMNDHVAYYLFRKMGVATPLDSYVYLKINNKPIGIYSAVEEVSGSFLKRNGLEGNLYKPEKLSGRDNGTSLTYRDDKTSSYSDIFSNSKNDITMEDEHRLVKSIRSLNTHDRVDDVVEVDSVIRYFAVHNFLLSYDSYTGYSVHNYYLLEKDGKLNMLPWDYNLSFGRFNMLTGTGDDVKYLDVNTIVNYGIDSPISQGTSEDRPMWNWILKNNVYLEKYHVAMNELLTNYLESGELDKVIDSEYALIEPYLKYDNSAFYTQEQIRTGVSTLKDICNLRTKSIRLQLDGNLSTYTDLQNNNDRVDASKINLNNMGLVADDSTKNES